ncbi:serine protease 33-like [Vombatus ursinus]|uniref:Peptidase S1 domain-containing protein n=1 Tax=Vombatus ursinus TaxID=29139 RepID=A0A4X2K753_VOMUR|nr:serine protease 33-like [Vombatus ursinus]
MGAVLYVLLSELLLLLLLPGYGPSEALVKDSPSSWPWLASIFLDDRYRCEGALISSEWVITLINCFGSFPVSHFTVGLGQRRLNLQNAEVLSLVEELIPIPRSLLDRKPGSLVLVKLTQPPSNNSSIYPISLAQGAIFFPWRKTCWAQGFKPDFDPYIPPDELWGVKMPLMSRTNCQAIFQLQSDCPSPEISMSNGAQCTGPPVSFTEITVADGSPLLCFFAAQWVLLGVMTWGPCSSNGLPEVYIPIYPIGTWIQDNFPNVRVVKGSPKAKLKSK